MHVLNIEDARNLIKEENRKRIIALMDIQKKCDEKIKRIEKSKKKE